MAISLYPHNATAYDAVLSMLAETGKACVVHPTGTGKSFIGFKYCEDHPEQFVLWLSPSEYIFKTQCENLLNTGAAMPENITFYTYQKLCMMDAEELGALRADMIVLDESHRSAARLWYRSVKTLLKNNPEALLLGLTATPVRFLDKQLDTCELLFDGCVASQLSLGEAIVRGILGAPTYVTALFSYQKQYERCERRVRAAKRRAARDRGEKLLDALRRAIERAEGLDEIFEKHIVDKAGKYLVFCSSYDHMREMASLAGEHFGRIDPQAHVYTVFSADPGSSKAFRDFKADDSEHLKLLYSVSMLNEGIHVDDVSGVILFRPTVSPIVFKQQIGRALTVGKKDAVIFDIVDNISNLYSIGALEEEMDDAVHFYRESGEGGMVIHEKFRVIDEVRDVKRLFDELENTLTASWEMLYAEARAYAGQNGDLLVPKSYVTEEGYHLGEWIITQRALHKNGQLSASKTLRLERIGMDWRGRNERCWEDNLKAAEQYVRGHGKLDPPGGTELQKWLNRMRMQHRLGLLSDEAEAALNKLGIVWDCVESSWSERLEQMRAYYAEHGELNIPGTYVTKDGFHLGRWYCEMKRQYRNGTLPQEKREQLEKAGMLWSSVHLSRWARHYQEAKAFYQANGHLNVPRSCVTEDGFHLAVWVSAQRQKRLKGELTPEQVGMLEEIGCVWETTDSRWEAGFHALEAYKRSFGTANIPFDFVTDEQFKLGQWLTIQRKNYRKGSLEKQKRTRLEALGVEWNVFQAKWQTGYDHAAAFAKVYGHLNVKHQYRAEDGYKLGVWISTQRERYREKRISEEEIRALETIGMKWRGEYHRERTGQPQRAEA